MAAGCAANRGDVARNRDRSRPQDRDGPGNGLPQASRGVNGANAQREYSTASRGVGGAAAPRSGRLGLGAAGLAESRRVARDGLTAGLGLARRASPTRPGRAPRRFGDSALVAAANCDLAVTSLRPPVPSHPPTLPTIAHRELFARMPLRHCLRARPEAVGDSERR